MNELTTTAAETADAGNTAMMLYAPGRLQALVTFAEMMAKSAITVPDHLKGKPSDCLAITMQALRWNMDPFAVAQKTHVVSGRLGYEAQLVNAVVGQSNAIRGAFRYEYRGEGQALECRVGAVLRGEEDITWGEWLKNSDVTTRNSPLWKVNPKQQLGYLQVKNWARLYCPGAILGVYSVDELETTAPPPANKHMGAADVVGAPAAAPAAPPTWPDDAFEKQMGRWRTAVEKGLKTDADIEALASSKGALTAEQLAAIRALKPVDTGPAAAVDPETGEFAAAYTAAEGAAQ
jgi:hypothetical protein